MKIWEVAILMVITALCGAYIEATLSGDFVPGRAKTETACDIRREFADATMDQAADGVAIRAANDAWIRTYNRTVEATIKEKVSAK
jgi:hypothetical protein